MSTHAVWFGPKNHAAFGWLHVPKRAVGGVVLCPPVGLEALAAHHAYRELSERLEREDLAVLRFDYHGTGDSVGTLEDVESIDTWIADIAAAVDEVRRTGVGRIGLVGLRLGANLALRAANAARVPPEGLVLWDPCESGTEFLRGRHVPAATLDTSQTVGVSPRGGVELPGIFLAEPLATSIAALDLSQIVRRGARRVLVLERPNRPATGVFREQLASEEVRWEPAREQECFIDVEPGAALVPNLTISRIVTWLADTLDGPDVASRAPREADSWCVAIVPSAGGREPIVERSVRIGERGLFGIVSEPSLGRDRGAPSIVFLNPGTVPHCGPARLWVDLARRWAAAGASVLRVDLSGLGDSPMTPSGRVQMAYPIEAIEDTAEVARFMAPEDPGSVVMIGLCSGAYHIIESAAAVGSRNAWLINSGVPMSLPSGGEGGARDPQRQAVRPLNPLTRRLRRCAPLVRACERWMPSAVWSMLDKVRLYPSAGRLLELLATRGTKVLVICGDFEADRYMKRSSRTMRRLAQLSSFQFERVPGMDHSLYGRAGRLAAARLLDERFNGLIGQRAELVAAGEHRSATLVEA